MKILFIIITLLSFFYNHLYAETNTQAVQKFDPESWYMIDVYLDADEHASTGMKSDWLYTASGIDYLAQSTFIYKHSGIQGSNQWSWTDLSSINRMCSFDSIFVEGLIMKNGLSNPSLQDRFGIAFPYYLHNTPSTDIIYFPENNDAYQQKKMFNIKPRQIIELNSYAELHAKDAYYYPFMNDQDIDSYLDFEATDNAESKNRQWASWAIQINNPDIYSLSLTMQHTEPTTLNITLIDMATNNTIKNFADIVIHTAHPQFTEITPGNINLQDIPAGKYMLKLKDYAAFTNSLKVEKIALNQSSSGTNSLNNETFNMVQNAGTITVSGHTLFNFNIYSLDGRTEVSVCNVLKHSHKLNPGVYLLYINSSNKNTVRKIVVH